MRVKAEKRVIGNQKWFINSNKQGIAEDLAYGVCAYLNSTLVDRSFRVFNGHTQVNATDLRILKYPSRKSLVKLGKWLKRVGSVDSEQIDEQLRELA